MTAPGTLMAREIDEQPEVWARLLDAQARPGGIHEVAAHLRAAAPRFVLLVARGTSDHAALYAKYLVEVVLELPAGLVSPSTYSAYGARPDLSGCLVVAVSQSGGSPDLLTSLGTAREQGALTVAVTNAPGSPLAQAAHHHLDVLAGPEAAVAATKSYTAQLLALHLLVQAWRGGAAGQAGVASAHALPDLGRRVLEARPLVVELAERYRFVDRMLVTGRGFSYPTAREAALKLMETAYVSAQAFSGADLMHGPLAVVDPLVPVLAVAGEGVGGRAVEPVLQRLLDGRADLTVVGDPAAVRRAGRGVPLPPGTPDALSPLLEILPLQLLALHLSVARGADPDAPRGLKKVTETL